MSLKIANRPQRNRILPNAILGLLLLFVIAGAGCKKSGGTGDASKAFQSAPAELKAAWESANAAVTSQTNDYATYLDLMDLHVHPGLSPEQSKAIEAHMTTVLTRLNLAARKGDADAKQALQEIRVAGRSRRGD
jgi:hypothetical protein